MVGGGEEYLQEKGWNTESPEGSINILHRNPLCNLSGGQILIKRNSKKNDGKWFLNPDTVVHHPPPTHLGLFGGEKMSQNKNFEDHIRTI